MYGFASSLNSGYTYSGANGFGCYISVGGATKATFGGYANNGIICYVPGTNVQPGFMEDGTYGSMGF